MKNRIYWKERFSLLEQQQNSIGLQCYADIEKQYRRAQKEIEGQIARWYQRFADNNNITIQEARRMLERKELAEFKWDVKDYIRYGQENAMFQQWMRQLENASVRYHISRLEALKIQTQQSLEVMFGNQLDSIDSAMRNVYTNGYYRTAFEIQKGVGVGWDFATLDDKQIAKVINKPWAADGKNFSERIWGNRQKLVNELNTELTRNIMLGQDPQKAIDAISRKMNTSKTNAGRLVMTEEAFFSSAAQKDCFNELDVEQFEIVATLDSRTSEICQEMDGKHFPMSQYEPGTTAPPFHVNCRSTTCPYFEDEFDSVGERAAKGEDGKTYYVPAIMTYKGWKKSFVDKDVIPKMSIIHETERIFTQQELQKMAVELNDVVDNHIEVKSKWSGKIQINSDIINYGKLWNCDIAIQEKTSPHILLHELLHARSISNFDQKTYLQFRSIEEATVQLMTLEICQKENIELLDSGYDELVESLRNISKKMNVSSTYDFAKKLMEISVVKRLDWLESEMHKNLPQDATITDYQEISNLLEKLS